MARHGASEPGSAYRANARERQARVLVLLREGKNYDEIAQEVGYSNRSGAYHAAMTALRELPRAGVEEWRTLQGERLEHLWRKLLPAIEEGDAIAIKAAVSVIEKLARLMGIPMGDIVKNTTVNQTLVLAQVNELVDDAASTRALEARLSRLVGRQVTIEDAVAALHNRVPIESKDNPC